MYFHNRGKPNTITSGEYYEKCKQAAINKAKTEAEKEKVAHLN